MKKKKLNVLITGASRGIGKAIATKIAPRCLNLFLTSKTENACATTKIEAENYAEHVYINHANHVDPKKAASYIKEWLLTCDINELDALILDAGMYIEGEMSSLTDEAFNENLNVNFLANCFIIHSLLPFLKKATSPRIIIIGSTAAYRPYCIPSYGVAKYALRGYALNLRKELSQYNIGVTFLSPGGTLTDMWEGEDIEEGRLLQPSDIANVVDTVFELSPQAVIDEIIIRPMKGDIDE